MGRPTRELTAAQRHEVETLAAVLTAAQLADYLGIGRTTFFSMMVRDDDIAERYKRGKARAIGAIGQSLITKARAGDTASMIFFLKTQAGWRETAQVELSGQGGGPVQILDVSNLSTTTLTELAGASWIPATVIDDAAPRAGLAESADPTDLAEPAGHLP